jgi:hypothetical protein
VRKLWGIIARSDPPPYAIFYRSASKKVIARRLAAEKFIVSRQAPTLFGSDRRGAAPGNQHPWTGRRDVYKAIRSAPAFSSAMRKIPVR